METVARQMRREPTEAEAALWKALRGEQVGGFRFRRSHAVGQIIGSASGWPISRDFLSQMKSFWFGAA